jgi:hypothetical protein
MTMSNVNKRRATAWVACIAAALAAAVVIVPAVTAKSHPAATFRVLRQAHTARDNQLPALSGTLSEIVASPSAAHYVGTVDGRDAYIAPGTGGTVCFLLASANGDVGGGCIESGSMRDQARYVGLDSGDGNVDLLVPVPDAYSEAVVNGRQIKAHDNVVLTTVPKGNGTVKLHGDGGDLAGDLALK